MIGVGRVCVKIAGRDAGLRCVVVDVLDDKYVLIDGETRRRKCNVLHLEPLDKIVGVRKGASHEDVAKIMKKEGWKVWQTKPKKPSPRPRKARRSKLAKQVLEEKPKKKLPAKKTPAPAKKAEKPEEAKTEKTAEQATTVTSEKK